MDSNEVVNILRAHLYSCIHTGSRLLDTLLFGFLLILSSKLYRAYKNYDKMSLQELYQFIRNQRRCEVVIRAKHRTSHSQDAFSCSYYFYALIDYIKDLDLDTAGVRRLKEIPLVCRLPAFKPESEDIEERTSYRNGRRRNYYNGDSSLLVHQPEPFAVDKDIMCTVAVSEQRDTSGRDTVHAELFEVVIYSDKLSCDELREWVEEKRFMYEKKVSACVRSSQYHYIYNPGSRPESENYNPGDYFLEYSLATSKDFTNLFFKQKPELINKLDFFLKNKKWYSEMGIPYTLGMMLHGLPGCGKTSAIKAIAKYTGRHIISVPLQRITTLPELLEIFFGEVICGRRIKMDKRLYIMEDFDAQACETLLADRTREVTSEVNGRNPQKQKQYGKKNLDLISILSSHCLKGRGVVGGRLTMSDILNILDGTLEMSGRMLIITSNHPEQLDAAMTRPGRIDLKLEFSLAKLPEIGDIFKLIYKFPIDDLLRTGAPRPLEDYWSHASVMNIFLGSIDRPVSALEKLSQPQAADSKTAAPNPVAKTAEVIPSSFLSPSEVDERFVCRSAGRSRPSTRHTNTESDDSYSDSDCSSCNSSL